MLGKLTKLLEENYVPRETSRDYIGASSIGSECLRQIWYECKGYEGEALSPKIKRTFAIGKQLESLILDELEQAGMYIVRDWWELVDEDLPYFRGHVDAIADNDTIIEIKTAKDSSHKLFVKNGLLRWQPKYYAQVQAYMGMSGIEKAIVIVLNKDSSELWDEEIKLDSNYYEGLRFKAEVIYESTKEPVRINNSPAFYMCKICKFKKICHE